jgi:hypothetical protein
MFIDIRWFHLDVEPAAMSLCPLLILRKLKWVLISSNFPRDLEHIFTRQIIQITEIDLAREFVWLQYYAPIQFSTFQQMWPNGTVHYKSAHLELASNIFAILSVYHAVQLRLRSTTFRQMDFLSRCYDSRNIHRCIWVRTKISSPNTDKYMDF